MQTPTYGWGPAAIEAMPTAEAGLTDLGVTEPRSAGQSQA
jgi:hypothetical protein